jgi:uncharacterized membrane protein
MKSAHPLRWYTPLALIRSLMLRPRVYFGAAAAIAVLYLLPPGAPAMVRASLAWDAGGFTYLIFAFALMASCGPHEIKARAAIRDDSRLVILVLILAAIVSSFAAIAGLIGEARAHALGGEDKLFLTALAAATIIVSWTVTQVAFALHYAHEYYLPHRGSDALAGLVFPGCEDPDYWDFLYFSTSIGATSQTSDTTIKSRALRRLVTLHCVAAFFFNASVLALGVNIAASLA